MRRALPARLASVPVEPNDPGLAQRKFSRFREKAIRAEPKHSIGPPASTIRDASVYLGSHRNPRGSQLPAALVPLHDIFVPPPFIFAFPLLAFDLPGCAHVRFSSLDSVGRGSQREDSIVKYGAGGGNRTHGLGIMRPSLCH